MIVQYIKVLTSLWAFPHQNTSGREERGGGGGRQNTWYQFWFDGLRRVYVHLLCYRDCARLCRVWRSTSHICTTRRKSVNRCGVRPLEDSAKQASGASSFIFGGPASWARVQPRAQPADHYRASGPYCFADGADRRERRQPACFLEGWGVCSWVREEGGDECIREGKGWREKCDFPVKGGKRVNCIVKWKQATLSSAGVLGRYIEWFSCRGLKNLIWRSWIFPVVLMVYKRSVFPPALFILKKRA